MYLNEHHHFFNPRITFAVRQQHIGIEYCQVIAETDIAVQLKGALFGGILYELEYRNTGFCK